MRSAARVGFNARLDNASLLLRCRQLSGSPHGHPPPRFIQPAPDAVDGELAPLIGERAVEMRLDEFWAEFSVTQDESVFGKVVAAAKAVCDIK